MLELTGKATNLAETCRHYDLSSKDLGKLLDSVADS